MSDWHIFFAVLFCILKIAGAAIVVFILAGVACTVEMMIPDILKSTNAELYDSATCKKLSVRLTAVPVIHGKTWSFYLIRTKKSETTRGGSG